MGASLENCIRCGRIFVRENNDKCPACLQKIEEEYHVCAEYLREHKLVNIYQLSEATEVSVKQITRFIKEGRISVADLPNLGYPCETCGTVISEGRFCKTCSDRLNNSIKKVLGDDATVEEEREKNIYFKINDRFNNK